MPWGVPDESIYYYLTEIVLVDDNRNEISLEEKRNSVLIKRKFN
jgi:hypothetical protein